MCVEDHQLHAVEAPALEAAKELGPEGFRLARTDAQADDLTPAVGVDRHGEANRHAEVRSGAWTQK